MAIRFESGRQMVARLSRKPDLDNFYPKLIKNGPKPGHTIEVCSENDTSCLLCDIICESLMPLKLGGKQSGVILFITDGKITLDAILDVLKKKIASCLSDLSLLENFLQTALDNLLIFEIYDATQFHASIQTMESILMNQPIISLIVFDTLTAFYWSEQSFKVMKMDVYLKYLLRLIQKVVKDHKVITIYSRPKYFYSSKDNTESLDPCCEHNILLEQLNYRIQVAFTDDETHRCTVYTFNENYKCSFKIVDSIIVWC